MKNLLKLLLPVITVAFVGCACSSTEKSCSKPAPACETACKKAAKDDSKEVHKVQY